jgi:hypothetical protein
MPNFPLGSAHPYLRECKSRCHVSAQLTNSSSSIETARPAGGVRGVRSLQSNGSWDFSSIVIADWIQRTHSANIAPFPSSHPAQRRGTAYRSVSIQSCAAPVVPATTEAPDQGGPAPEIAVFSSTQNTAACCGGVKYNPITSAAFVSKSGCHVAFRPSTINSSAILIVGRVPLLQPRRIRYRSRFNWSIRFDNCAVGRTVNAL